MPAVNPCLRFSLLFFFFPSVSALNPQGQTLLSWKQTLNGSIQAFHDWDPAAENPCRWSGVFCNSENEVVEINVKYIDLLGNVPSNFTDLQSSLRVLSLSGANLTGTIPDRIGELRELRVLDLSDNALRGEIPSGICGLRNLEKLYLNTNRLEGSIPDGISNLTGLVELVLYDNQISGGIPASIGGLNRLEVIRAGGNKGLAGPIPKEIGNCTSLVMVGLAETSVSGFLPPEMGRLKRLKTVAIYTALLSGEIPPEIGDCDSLEEVYLYENSLTGSIPAAVGRLRNLKSLLLWQNNLVGTIPPAIGNCSKLEVIDLSLNSLTGAIPESFGSLLALQELQMSVNQLSGRIPAQLGNCRALTHIELDNNQLTGGIPPELGDLPALALLFLWQNRLEGTIPISLSDCQKLEAVDLSQNALVGPIPAGLFQLQNLNKLLLLSNNLSGSIPPEIGNCTSLIRLRANSNKLTGSIPADIGRLKNLNFLDLGSNRLSGTIPDEISGCRNLTFLDLHFNSISGTLPANLNRLVVLQFLDVSGNFIEGALNPGLGSLNSLTKLVLRANRLSGSIPTELGSCLRLQLLDLSSNQLEGNIPGSLGNIPGLEIALNLSGNRLSGGIPAEFTALDRLGVLDISHNSLSGDLHFLPELQNLVALNVSYNNFSGQVPTTPFFAKLPLSDLSGNPRLCLSDCVVSVANSRRKAARAAMAALFCTACLLLATALYIIVRGKIRARRPHGSNLDCDDLHLTGPWEVTLYQKRDMSITDIVRCLTVVNVIGEGLSGIVYRATIPLGPTIAVKRFHLSEKYSAASFSSEITTLAWIRHRNIVRLLGWAANRWTKLLLYDYLPNGTLGGLLHDARGERVDWEIRYKIALGVAEGLAYLHHDCMPPILHRDVKTHNILLGDRYEPCLADFGLARFIEDGDTNSVTTCPQFAGSYGYFAPEYASMLRITTKSDVYSYGVVLLEIITGKKPVDPSFPEGQHVIQWVRNHQRGKRESIDAIDTKLQGHPDTQVQEMLQALDIALLCTSNRPEERPPMKDVVALLKEIKHEQLGGGDQGHKPTTKPTVVESNVMLDSSTSMARARLLLLQDSSNGSLAYSSSSASYNTGNR